MASLLIPGKKVEAQNSDGFYTPSQYYPPPEVKDLSYSTNENGSVNITWKIYASDVKKFNESLLDLTLPFYIDGFIIKSSKSAPYECNINKMKNGLVDCSGRALSEKPTMPIHVNPISGRQRDNGENSKLYDFWQKNSSVTYEITETTPGIAQQMEGAQIGVQTYNVGNDFSKSYGPVNRTEFRTTQPDLGDAFSDDNITAYIKNKLSIYEGGKVPSGALGVATAEDQQTFSTFMNAFKNCSDCWARQSYKTIENSPNQDPFKFFGANDSSGKWQSLLTESEISALYDEFYKNYNGDTDANMSNFNAKTKKIRDQFIETIVAADNPNSCSGLDQRLKSSIGWHDLYVQLGAAMGAIGGAFITRSPWGVIGAGIGGAALGDTLKATVNSGIISDADKQMGQIAKDFGKAYYAMMYLGMKEAKLGLTRYKTEGDSTAQWYGMNPLKARIVNEYMKIFLDKFQECFKDIMADINALQADVAGNTCGLKLTGVTTSLIAAALCEILKMFGQIGDWLTSTLFQSIYDAYRSPPAIIKHLSFLTAGFSVQKAHAANDNVSELTKILDTKQSPADYTWVVTSWKWILALTNLFLVVILLFLGIVNILHIQYDTYAIKKMLPFLIIGVVLANFSLLIVRMLVDAANILTKSFLGNYPGGGSKLVHDLISQVIISDKSQALIGDWNKVGILLLAVILGAFAVIAFLILGVMFYIRFASIILLAIVAPLAFVLLAFPPTQSVFKQWWSWATKMTFMKPIAFFLLYMASFIKNSGAGATITGWLIMMVIIYVAIIIPWKLGGVVMGVWGGAMGTLFGTKKGGWARKPVDEWWQRRKDQAGAAAKLAMPWLFSGAQADRDITEAMKKKAAAKVGKHARLHDPDVSFWQKEAEDEENSLKALVDRQMTQLEEGKYKINIFASIIAGGIKGMGNAATHKEKYAETEKELILAAKDREANKNGVIIQKLIKEGRLNGELTDQEKEMLAKGKGVRSRVLDKKGQLEVEIGEDGKEKLMTEREARELASVIRLRALGLKDGDPNKANLERSALELEADASQFQQGNQYYTDANGVRQRMRYDKFMDKRLSGRIISIVTPLLMEEIQTNMLNENFKSMQDRMNKVIGFKNFRANGNIQHLIVQGKFSELDPMEIMVGVAELQTRLGFIGKKGDRNRALHLWDFIHTFDNGATFGKENAGRMLRGFIGKSEEIVDGSTGEALAEVVLNARARGVDIPGFEKIAPTIRGNARDMQARFIDEMKKQGIDPKKLVAEHPELLQQFDMTNVPQNRAQIRWVNNVAEVMQEISMTTGAGNPSTYTIKTKNTPIEKLWEELEEPYNPATLAQAMNRSQQSEAAAQRDTQQIDHMASTPTERLAQEHGSYQRAYQSLEASPDSPAMTLGTKLNGLSQLVDVDVDTFRRQVAQVIANSLATTFAGLEDEINVALPDVLVDLSELKKHDTEENVKLFKEDVKKTTEATTRLQEVREGAAAEEIMHSVPGVQQNLDLSAIEAGIARLETASNNFASELGKVNTGQSTSIPPEVLHELLQAMSSIQPIVPLTKNMLGEDESKAGDIAAKILVKLKAFAEMKKGREAETPENTLKAILKQIKALDQNLRQIAGKPGVIKAEVNAAASQQTAGTQASAAPTQPAAEKPAAKPEEEQEGPPVEPIK